MANDNNIKGMPPSYEGSASIAKGSFRAQTIEALQLSKEKYNGKLLGSGSERNIDPLSKAVIEYVYNNNIDTAYARFAKNGNTKEFQGKLHEAEVRYANMQKTFSIEKYADYVSRMSGATKDTLVSNLEAALAKVDTNSLSEKNKSLLAKVWGKIKPAEKTSPSANTSRTAIITKNNGRSN